MKMCPLGYKTNADNHCELDACQSGKYYDKSDMKSPCVDYCNSGIFAQIQDAQGFACVDTCDSESVEVHVHD